MKLAGARVLITGASGGLGAAIARELSRRGTQLVLSGRRADALQALADEIGAEPIVADLFVADGAERLAAAAGPVDVLIANAGLPASGELSSFAVEEIDRALAVNLRAPIVLAHELIGDMIERRHGHLLFVSSLSGKVASPRASLYNATKFGLRGFAHALRAELAPSGVGVSVILPGFVRDAGMFHDSGAKLPRGIGTSSPDQVAVAVARAIERNRAEVEVAPLPLRAGAAIAALAPGIAIALSGRASMRLATRIASGQRSKR